MPKGQIRRFFTSSLWSLGALGALVAFTACSARNPTPDSDDDELTLIWSDEFDGDALNTDDWNIEYGTGAQYGLVGWGNGELQYYSEREENLKVEDGRLLITAREEAYAGQPYTSGRITSMGKVEQAYGRIEASIKLPTGQGIWPAFWMLGNNQQIVGWPECGEIDIMEHRGQLPDIVTGALHGPGYSGGNPISDGYTLADGDFYENFHTFSVEWQPDIIRWYVDGTQFMEVNSAQLGAGQAWVYDHPFFLLLNVAVGGAYVGAPDDTTVFPQTMEIDWVRIYGNVE